MTRFTRSQDYVTEQARRFDDNAPNRTTRTDIRNLAQDTADTFSLQSTRILGNTGNITPIGEFLNFTTRSLLLQPGQSSTGDGGALFGVAIFQISGRYGDPGHDVPIGTFSIFLQGDSNNTVELYYALNRVDARVIGTVAINPVASGQISENIWGRASAGIVLDGEVPRWNLNLAVGYFEDEAQERNNYEFAYGIEQKTNIPAQELDLRVYTVRNLNNDQNGQAALEQVVRNLIIPNNPEGVAEIRSIHLWQRLTGMLTLG